MRPCNDAALRTLAVTAHGHAGTAQQRLPVRMAVTRGLVERQLSPGADVAGVSPVLAAGLAVPGGLVQRQIGRETDRLRRAHDLRTPAVKGKICGRNKNPPRCNAKYADATGIRCGATQNMRTQQESAAVQRKVCGRNRNPPRCNRRWLRSSRTAPAGPKPGFQRLLSQVCVCVCARARLRMCACACACDV